MRMTKDKARGAYGTAQRLRVVNHGVSPSVQHLVCLTYPLCHNCIFSVNSVFSVLKKSTAQNGKFLTNLGKYNTLIKENINY